MSNFDKIINEYRNCTFFNQKDYNGKTIIKNYRRKTEKLDYKYKYGCGPSTATNMLYINEFNLYPQDTLNELANKLYSLIQPYAGGSSGDMLVKGINEYLCVDKYIALKINSNTHKNEKDNRNNNLNQYNDCINVIKTNIAKNKILCWMNHDNANLPYLESWHWVNIISINQNDILLILDNNKFYTVDFKKWWNDGLKIGSIVGLKL